MGVDVVNWAAVGAIVGIIAVVEVPMIAIVGWGARWVRSVNERLARIEDRSHQRRWDDEDC
jgi:hypothetical protein